MTRVTAFVAGLLFGIGLLWAGMADPAKVLAFLDLAGHWDPSLAFVMGGGIGAAIVPFTLARRRQQSLAGCPMQLPTRRDIDAPLILGSLLFGIGWGIAGYCPGPALANLAHGTLEAIVFVIVLIAGSQLARPLSTRRIA